MLPLHFLRQFHEVATQRGFNRAAEALHVSQPAISRAVRELETQLGAPLIERGPGPFRLTEAGALLHERARELFAVERAAEHDLAALAGLAAGQLAIGASTTIAEYHLPPLIARFHAAHPGVALRLAAANTHDIAAGLIALDVDIALVEGPVTDKRIAATPWRTERMQLVAAPSHRLAARAALSPADLHAETFVLREPGSGTRDVANAALRGLGLADVKILESGSTPAIKQIVAAGLGVAIVPERSAADQIALGRLVVLPFTLPPRTLWRLSLPGRRPTAAAAAFEILLHLQA